MLFLIAVIFLLVIELFYFKIADRWNIIDKPNTRSSHSYLTIRGGGIVFLFAFWAWDLQSDFQFFWASLGLLLIGLVSIWDDIQSLPNRVRITAHVCGILLLMYDTALMESLPLWAVIVVPVVIIGTLNAYNFMDGINGITGLYSLSILLTLGWLNQDISFIDPAFFEWTTASLLIFLFFNFRKKAKCFAGDVGSMGIGFIVIFALTLLIVSTGELKYILFITLYGMDTVLTIVQRLFRKENIFKAHRLHFYQLLVNQLSLPHRMVSMVYALLQLLINGLIIWVLPSHWPFVLQGFVLVLPFTLAYILCKWRLMLKIEQG